MNILLSRTAILITIIIMLVVFSTAVPVRAAAPPETGISLGTTLLVADNTELDYRLRDIHNMGAKWIRIDFDWTTVQPKNHSNFQWKQYDRIVHAATKRHLKVLATLAYTPVWARNVRCQALTHSAKCSPRSTEEFARFARAAVLRYKSQGVHTWEIWNEPNLVGHWKTAHSNKSITVDPAAYARLANDTARQIRLHDAHAFIITGGLAPQFDPQSPAGLLIRHRRWVRVP